MSAGAIQSLLIAGVLSKTIKGDIVLIKKVECPLVDLRQGQIDRLRVVTADALPTSGEVAAYTRKLIELRKQLGADAIEWFHVYPKSLK